LSHEKKEKTKAKGVVSFRVAMKKMISIDLGIGINGPSSPFYEIDCRKGCWVIDMVLIVGGTSFLQ
jgi:hypothetical protein